MLRLGHHPNLREAFFPGRRQARLTNGPKQQFTAPTVSDNVPNGQITDERGYVN
jgi:hypothetical protein